MKKIDHVAILGAGALGSFFITRFLKTEGVSTSVIAREPRYSRLKNNGLIVNGQNYTIPVVRPDQATEHADLIIVALKHHHLSSAVPDMENFVGDKTVILSAMNGLDSEEVIGSFFGIDKLLYAIIVAIEANRQGNRMRFNDAGRVFFGEADNTTLSERVRRVQDVFDRAGIRHETPANMIKTMWWKFMINVGINQASAVMRAPYGVFQSSVDARDLMRALMDEVNALAGTAGVHFEQKDFDNWYDFLKALSPDGKTSMLQDIEASRKTEVDIFAGKIVALGKKYDIPTPVNQTVLRIIKVLEQYPE